MRDTIWNIPAFIAVRVSVFQDEEDENVSIVAAGPLAVVSSRRESILWFWTMSPEIRRQQILDCLLISWRENSNFWCGAQLRQQ